MSLRPDQMKLALEVLEKLPLFAGTSPDQRAVVTTVLDYRALGAGKVAILEKEISKTLHILAKGAVGIWRRVNTQKEKIAILRAPDFFGEVSMFSDATATALVKTEEDSQFFLLKREAFDRLISQDPVLGQCILKNMLAIQPQRLPGKKP